MLLNSTIPLTFWRKVYADPSGCWLWRGAKSSTGYGNFNSPANKTHKAHRFAYERLVGPVARDKHLDHLCRTPLCVHFRHLEPVTPKANINRGIGHGIETHCPRGHVYDAMNTYVHNNKRFCRACRRASDSAIESRRRRVRR